MIKNLLITSTVSIVGGVLGSAIFNSGALSPWMSPAAPTGIVRARGMEITDDMEVVRARFTTEKSNLGTINPRLVFLGKEGQEKLLIQASDYESILSMNQTDELAKVKIEINGGYSPEISLTGKSTPKFCLASLRMDKSAN